MMSSNGHIDLVGVISCHRHWIFAVNVTYGAWQLAGGDVDSENLKKI